MMKVQVKKMMVLLSGLLMGFLLIASIPMIAKADVIRENLDANMPKDVTTQQIEIKQGKVWAATTENIDNLLNAAGYDYKSEFSRLFHSENLVLDTNYLTPACGVGVHDVNTQQMLDFLYVADSEWTDLITWWTDGTLTKKYGAEVMLVEEAEGFCYYARADKAGTTTIVIPEYPLSSGETITVNIPVLVKECVSSDILYTGEGEKAPTCTSEGIGHKECTDCGKILESSIKVPKLAHTLTYVAEVAATTEKAGMKAHYCCSSCNKLFSDAGGKKEVTKDSLIIAKIKEKKPAAKGSIIKDKDGNKYKVTKSDLKNGTVAFVAAGNKKATTIKIANTVKVDGITYKVTSIQKDAFKNNKYLKKVTIGNNITTIGANAFYGCKKLKTVTIETKLLKTSNIGKNAFKGIKTDATIKVPKSKYSAYKTMLCKKGVNKKTKFKKI